MITRGILDASTKFIRELSGKYVSVPFRNKKNEKIVNVPTPIHVRPIQLWEIVIPKESKDIVMTTLFPTTTDSNNKGTRMIMNILKKFLPIKPVPKKWDNSKTMLVQGDGVERICLGIKDDVMMDFTGRNDNQMKSIGLDPKGDWESEAL